jgi:hypothetical protein
VRRRLRSHRRERRQQEVHPDLLPHLLNLEVECFRMIALALQLQERAERVLVGIERVHLPPPPISDPPESP